MGLVDGAVSVHAYPLLHAELVQLLGFIHSFCLLPWALKDVDILVPVWICTFSLLPCALSGYEDGATIYFSSVRNFYCAVKLLSLDL